MKHTKTTTDVAGVDISKNKLDIAFARSDDHRVVPNMPESFAELIPWLREHGVARVGMEATGGYERGLRTALEKAGFEVVVHQPAEVRHFAKFKRLRAKSDKIDARLIAKATQHWEGIVARRDPEVIELAEMLTMYEHISGLLTQTRNAAEHHTLPEVKAVNTILIKQLFEQKKLMRQRILCRIKANPDLAKRSELLKSLPGFGPIVAAAMVIRMPELGQLEHGRASSLLGVAPFDHDSGNHSGKRFISGGRQRPRDMAYIAALAAKRMTNNFKVFADRLLAKGKPKRVVIIAVMRKLIEAANLVLKRQTKWEAHLDEKKA